jgi:hypothetical protein
MIGRKFGILSFCSLGLALLVACGVSSTQTIATATAELQTITTAINTEATVLIQALPAADQAKATLALQSLNTLNTSIQAGGLSSTDLKQDLLTALSSAQSLVAILPLAPETQAATQAGILLAQAIVANLPVTVPAQTASVSLSSNIVPGPIPIPLSQH